MNTGTLHDTHSLSYNMETTKSKDGEMDGSCVMNGKVMVRWKGHVV